MYLGFGDSLLLAAWGFSKSKKKSVFKDHVKEHLSMNVDYWKFGDAGLLFYLLICKGLYFFSGCYFFSPPKNFQS
jgi:hypothetical protein